MNVGQGVAARIVPSLVLQRNGDGRVMFNPIQWDSTNYKLNPNPRNFPIKNTQ